MRKWIRRLVALGAIVLATLWAASSGAVDGPLTNALNLRARTDTNGYLVATLAAYTGPDGPLTNLGNLRVRTDANGYLLVTTNGALNATVSALGTTSTDRLLLQNLTASTAGVPVQISPRARWCGTAWNSVGLASETDCWFVEDLPATVAGTTTSTLKFGSTIAGAAATYPFTISNTGVMTAGSLVFPISAATGAVLIASSTNTLSALTPGSVRALPANQTGNATATLKMNGLGNAAAPCVITPASSGRVEFSISGQAVQDTTLDGVTWKMSYGTGAAPSNAGAAAGTIISAQETHTVLTGALEVPFTLTASATGLSLVATWFDLQVANVTGGTASITNVTCSAIEF